MLERLTPARLLAAACALLVPLFVLGWLTREDPAEKPWLQVMGGGFIFNYRVADVYYGFTAAVMRPLPTGTIVEAAFEDPAGGPPHVVRQRVGGAEMTRLALRSPPVRGVEAGRDYAVSLRVLDREDEHLLWSRDLAFRSNISDTVVPDVPLTIGPGYTRNPAAGG
ncbi:MAG: hypothetical protein M9945_08260 [Aquamicrobium sp.]|uniref:hypothetical protein n=1 Tax=Aquamicrobium sp. TaxID=1872579 RepID=UPI00349EAF57|nr:hypothetical protein [Aquamicrobium sp.]